MIEETGGVDTLAIDACLEMQVLGGGTARTSRESQFLPSAHAVAHLHQILGIVAVEGLQTVGMLQYDTVAVAAVSL